MKEEVSAMSGKIRIGSRIESYVLKFLVWLCIAITVGVLVLVVGNIAIKGIPNITLDLFALEYNSTNLSLFPALVNTLVIVLLSLIMAVPFGVGAAIYLVEYASKKNKFVNVVRITTETLQGIPSIVYGLFGYLFFLVALGWGYSILSGSCTMAIMILPLIMRSTEEALLAVPDTYREGSFGVGAGKLRTVFKVVLPSAMPGILSGIILAIGRIVGETVALIYTAGTVAQTPSSLFSSGRTLSVHMYVLWNEGLSSDQSYATAVILLIFVVILNALSTFIANKLGVGGKNDKN